ncbi:hypothetical protein SATRM34S_06951 [Streptomyces atroolivaceus]
MATTLDDAPPELNSVLPGSRRGRTRTRTPVPVMPRRVPAGGSGAAVASSARRAAASATTATTATSRPDRSAQGPLDFLRVRVDGAPAVAEDRSLQAASRGAGRGPAGGPRRAPGRPQPPKGGDAVRVKPRSFAKVSRRSRWAHFHTRSRTPARGALMASRTSARPRRERGRGGRLSGPRPTGPNTPGSPRSMACATAPAPKISPDPARSCGRSPPAARPAWLTIPRPPPSTRTRG